MKFDMVKDFIARQEKDKAVAAARSQFATGIAQAIESASDWAKSEEVDINPDEFVESIFADIGLQVATAGTWNDVLKRDTKPVAGKNNNARRGKVVPAPKAVEAPRRDTKPVDMDSEEAALERDKAPRADLV